MSRKILALILVFAFVLSQTVVVDAKGFKISGGGRSFSKSFGSGFSGSSKSSKGLFSSGTKAKSSTAKSSGGYSGSSSSRSVPGSYSAGSSAKASTASASKKSSYMQDAYKKQTSSSNYSAYKQKLNAEQQKVYDSAMNNSSFTNNRRMNFEDSMNTRTQRINNFNSRPIYVNVRPGLFSGPFTWGMGYVGMWDLWFLMHASNLFWYNHWNEIYPYRDQFDQQKFAEMEARVKALEQQNNGVRDPNYMDPDVDPDLQLSKAYQEKNVDKVYYTDKYSQPSTDPVATVIIIILIGGVLFMVLSKAARPKPKKTYNSRIY